MPMLAALLEGPSLGLSFCFAGHQEVLLPCFDSFLLSGLGGVQLFP